MRESTIEAARPASGALGIELSSDSPVKITKLLSSSCFLGKLFVGDIILAVNDHTVKKRDDFYKKAEGAPTLKVKFERDEYCSCKINALPAPRKGCEAFDLELKWRKGGMPIGILVYQDIEKRVVVSVVESGSLAQDSIKAGDVVVKVNGVSVEDGKAGAKKMIYKSVSEKSAVTLTIERQLETAKPAKSPMRQPPSVIKSVIYDLLLPDDVLGIMAANRDFFKQPQVNQSILKKTKQQDAKSPSKSGKSRSSISPAKPDEEPIEFDPGAKQLRSTPKRIGS